MYYAVKKGHTTGIFDKWADVQTAIKGFSEPEYKKVQTKEEAEAYLNDKDWWGEQISKENQAGYLVAFTAGSYNVEQNKYSYGIVFILPDGTEKSICGHERNNQYPEDGNIIGEIAGVLNVLDWAALQGYTKVKIYHKYAGISKWLHGEWKAKKKISKEFISLYKSQEEKFTQIDLEQIEQHNNIVYHDEAAQLAKSIFVRRRKLVLQGENWLSVSYINKKGFKIFLGNLAEADANITHTVDKKQDRDIYRFSLGSEVVTVSVFKSGQHKILLQGKNTYLFHVVATMLVEQNTNNNIEEFIGNAYHISIDKDDIDGKFNIIEMNLPSKYPQGIKNLIKQSIINLTYDIESEDYSQYAFPALRALEGHMKYLIVLAGGTPGRNFKCFGLDSSVSPARYVLREKFTDSSKNHCIEECYNYYVSQRNTLVHFGDVINLSSDNTRGICKKEDANEIIKKCIDLISTQQ